MFLKPLLLASLMLVISATPQDIHIHLDGDSPGKGPDAGAGVVEEGDDYTSDVTTEGSADTREGLEKKIKELEEKLKNCKPGTDTGSFVPNLKCNLKPKVTGPCRAAKKKWSYIVETKISGTAASGSTKCVEFTYGGCQGNGNRFDSKIDCEMTCMGQGVGEPPKPPKGPKRYDTAEAGTDYAIDGEGNTGNIEGPSGSGPFKQHPECKLKANVTGRFCAAAVKKWTYIQEKVNDGDPHNSISREPAKCVEFTYGGCGGNNNKFPDKLACESSCIGPPKGSGPKRYETSDSEPKEAGTDYASSGEGGDGDVKCTYECDKKSKGSCRANWNEGGGSASGTCIPEGANPMTPGGECAVHDKCKDCHAQMRKKGTPCGGGKGDTGGASPSGDGDGDNNGDGDGDGDAGGIKCEYRCERYGNCRVDWTKTVGRTDSSGWAECGKGDPMCYHNVPEKCKSCHSAMKAKGETCE